MATVSEQVAAAAREAVARLFVRSKLRLGVIRPPGGDKRLFLSVDPAYTLPAVYEEAAREHGIVGRRAGLAEVRRTAAGFLEAQKESAQAAVGRVVHRIVDRAGGVLTPKTKKELRGALDMLFTRITAAVDRIVDTEVTAARNYAGDEAIVAMNTAAGVEDPVIFWVISHDNAVCSECVKIHTIDGKVPRLWYLSEASAAYHVRGEDRPSLQNLHPHCRCLRTTLLPGWGFDASGNVKFVAIGHKEIEKQRAGR